MVPKSLFVRSTKGYSPGPLTLTVAKGVGKITAKVGSVELSGRSSVAAGSQITFTASHNLDDDEAAEIA